ncbi:bacteriocin-like protein [Chryseobacterium limigenitum]|uniref:Bacteriocin-type signal sequence-containing protein n=1 Tax=Chryseobacterium limigenitum TaxID=1612149 RepID=A0A1K2ILG9_9FLAO|nr:hypothetical protein [Chryseobacterium limigenitum]SFZ93292.1 hypothetical protein SAMN05216324_10511 [Chryseobacterium limigenitum]
MLKNLKKLNRGDLKGINGGIEKCDIGPVGCPCKIPAGHECLGGSGGGPDGPVYGYCPNDGSYILCDQYCSDGRQPLCPLG